METLPYLLVALLALCVMPSALSLQCYECTNAPGFPGVTKCDSDNVGKRTCDQLSDRCMTIEYNFSLGGLGSLDVVMKNCSSSLACDPQFEFNWCKTFEITGLASNCTSNCCQGDLCNGPSLIPSSTPSSTMESSTIPGSTMEPTNSSLGLASSLGAIFSALVLTVHVFA